VTFQSSAIDAIASCDAIDRTRTHHNHYHHVRACNHHLLSRRHLSVLNIPAKSHMSRRQRLIRSRDASPMRRRSPRARAAHPRRATDVDTT
jgi:hypothetical protein